MTQPPYKRYAPPGLSGLLVLGIGMLEEPLAQWLGEMEFPFGWVAFSCLAIILGQLIADWNNPGSWLRERWDYSRRLFDLKGPWPTSKVIDDKEYFLLTIKLKFIRDIERADILLKVYFCVKPGEANFRFSKKLDDGQRIIKDEERQYVLAVIPKAQSETGWCGPFNDPHKESLTHGSKNILEISVRDRSRSQSRKIYLEMFLPGTGTGGRFSFLDETSPIFQLMEEPYVPQGVQLRRQ